ncbi:MAG: hypothetical protein KIT73_10930, partial [Burkholderiales bacterium]|nr:hypothetical protein [Burkholderiales bacterium]
MIRRGIATIATWAAVVGTAAGVEFEPPVIVEVLQNGVAVSAIEGEVVLDREAFTVRVMSGAGALSVYATTDPDALGNGRALWSAPLVAPLGQGIPAAPLSLTVDEAPLEFYGGLTDGLRERWASTLGPAQLEAFRRLGERLSRPPNILMSGRQFQNVRIASDGAQQMFVARLGPERIRHAHVDAVTVFLFVDRKADEERPLWAVVESVEVLRLRFRAAASPSSVTAENVPAAVPWSLDCGSSGVVKAVRSPEWQRVERLMQQGVDPNLRSDRGGTTLLMCAVGVPEVYGSSVGALLEAGASIDARTARDETALQFAIRASMPGEFSAA